MLTAFGIGECVYTTCAHVCIKAKCSEARCSSDALIHCLAQQVLVIHSTVLPMHGLAGQPVSGDQVPPGKDGPLFAGIMPRLCGTNTGLPQFLFGCAKL